MSTETTRKTTRNMTRALCRAALALLLALGLMPGMAFAAQGLQAGAAGAAGGTATGTSVSTLASAPGKGKVASAQSVAAGKAVVKAKKVSGAAGYQYKVSLNKSFTSGVKTKTTAKRSVTFKGLAAGATYYVKVRAYKKSGSKKKWGKWSAKTTVRVASVALTKRTGNGMWFLPAQNGEYYYGSVSSAYLAGSQLVFIGGGATRGWSQGDGVMMEDQPGANSSFTVTSSTRYSHSGQTISKSAFAKLLAGSTSLDYLQIDVSNGKVTNVYL